jgi:hypothetical protein
MNWATFGTRLAQLGGADPRLLPKVPAAKGKFIQMGLVLLSTAGLAVVSMSFALIDALRAPWYAAVPLGLCWGFVILNLDRLLIQNLRPGSRVWQTIFMIIPRLAVAALLGLVIATPLVVRVFQAEIVANMTQENAKDANVLGTTRAESPEAKSLSDVKDKIATDEGIMAGNVPGLTSPNIQTASAQLKTAQTTLADKRKVAADAYDQMICERDGVRCHGGSGKKGEGERYDSLKRLYDIAAADLDTAQRTVKTAQQAMDDATAAALKSNNQSLAQAQQRAKAELPGFYAQRDTLQVKVNSINAGDSDVVTANTGMLARIEALNRIGHDNPSARWAHLAVAGLLFMIELLPVLVKLLTSLGPPSIYDQISDLEDNSTIDEATRRRHEDRRRIERESKKQREIDEDMLSRETKLGVRGNQHVEKEMETILDAALTEWSLKVQRTLHRNAAPKATGAPPNNRAGQNGTARPGPVPKQPPRPGDPSVRSNYNLPSAGTL